MTASYHPRLASLFCVRLLVACVVGCSIFFSSAAEISGGGAQAKKGLKKEERPPEPQLQPASDEPLKVLKKFAVPAGCRVEVWAAEPMLGNPVAFSIDAQGRIFTAETYRLRTSVLDIRHYMFMLEDDMASRTTGDRIAYTKKNFPNDWPELEKETEIVRVLEDTHGTGKADSSSVYADGFNTMLDGIASGVLAHEGKVWLTNIPHLWLLTGMQPDGRAAKRESLSEGYGVRFSFTGHDMHGLALGPDGRLYFSFGDRGAHVKTREGRTLAFPDEGGVFRCELDGSHMEAVYRGLRNPQELAFDNHGNLFTGDNDCDQGDRERWVYIVEGGDAGWRVGWQHPPLGKEHNMWLTEHLWEPRKEGTPASVLSPILNIPDGPSGVTHYPGTGLPAEYDDAFFVCGFKGSSARSAISWWRVRESGAGFEKEKSPAAFVDHVQATDVDFGPDSRMYFSEWGEGWEGTGRGRIFKLEHPAARAAQARQVAEVERLFKEGFKQRSSVELAKLLAHKDQRIRLNAQWELVGKSDGAEKFLAVAKSGSDALARVHAVWGLGHVARLAGYESADAGAKILERLLVFAGDKDSEFRAQIVHVLGDGRVPAAFDTLVQAIEDPAPRVRFFAAQGLAKFGRQEAAKPVLALLRANDDKDEFLRHAGMMALAACGEDTLALAARDESRAVRLAALLAMRRSQSPAVAQFLADKDPLLVKEAARAINDEGIDAAFPALAKFIAAPMADENVMLRVLNANFRLGTPAAARTLADYAAGPAPEPLRIEALRQLGAWPRPAQRDRVTGLFRPLGERIAQPAIAALGAALPKLFSAKADKVQLAAIDAAAALGAKDAAPALLALMEKPGVASKVRARALETLGAFNDPKLAEAIKLALTDRDASLRIAASAMLGKLEPDQAATRLSTAFAGSDIAGKKAIVSALGDIQSPVADRALSAMLGEMQAGRMPGEVQLELLEAAAKRSAPDIQKKLKAREANQSAGDSLEKFAAALTGGDPDNGEKLFKEHVVAQCYRCHKVGEDGGDAGPNLAGIGSKKDRRYILESIVNPNAQIAEGFQTIMVTLKNGDLQGGIVKAETADDLTLQMPAPGAVPVKVKKADIKARENAASGMPPGLGDLLTRRELRDIVEYVVSLKE